MVGIEVDFPAFGFDIEFEATAPPDRQEWVLKIPKGTRDLFLTEYAKVPDKEKITYIRHRIRFGETLSTIARRYGISMSVIKRFNKLRGTRIRAGSSLIIPVPQNKAYYRYARNTPKRTAGSGLFAIFQVIKKLFIPSNGAIHYGTSRSNLG